MPKKTRIRLLIVISVFMSAALACNFPAISGSSIPPTAKPLSTEEVLTLEQQIQATLLSPNANGEVSITLTQAQINGLIVSQMAQQQNQVITDPSIVLTPGQMEVYGKVNQSGISANVKVVLKPAVDANGNAKLNVVTINLGGVPVPDVLKNQIESAADNAMNNSFVGTSTGLRARNIIIGDGQMTLTGTRQQ